MFEQLGLKQKSALNPSPGYVTNTLGELGPLVEVERVQPWCAPRRYREESVNSITNVMINSSMIVPRNSLH